ncbi:MAG: lysophospholipid acyltransferase family protein [Synechococcales bacterium]|nr:lysophospholipid acyltransferase family protein [Synechococcales bacterium]
MSADRTLWVARQILRTVGTHAFLYHRDRIPQSDALIVVSNHRSILDAPLLTAALERPIRFACHHYMGEVPVMRELVTSLGGFPLDSPDHRQRSFFRQATRLLATKQAVGIFPEGAEPMVRRTDPSNLQDFQRGFAHLALRAPVSDLAVLPVAIASFQEDVQSAFPLRLLHWFDPSEPLFDQPGWHPLVVYERVNVFIGRPIWITPAQQDAYQGKTAKAVVNDLTNYCYSEIDTLLTSGC